MSDFEGKTAIVTGAAQGMGRAYVELLSAQGANVVLADINEEAAQATIGEIGRPDQMIAVKTDVSAIEACEACAAAAKDKFGGTDILINNAGLLTAAMYPSLIEMPVEEYHRILGVMTHGMLWMARAVVPSMIERGGGGILNVSSIGAYQAAGIYSLSKAAVNSITVNLAHDLAKHNIRVNAIAPGTVATKGMEPLMSVEQMSEWGKAGGRPTDAVASPEQIAKVGVFLLSDAASYVRGQIVAVDDGQQIRL